MVKNNLPKQSKGEMLLATASQTVKKENERKSALTAAGVKDIAAYDKAYAPLKDFDKDVTSLYAEINGLLGFDNISDSQLNHAKTNAQELKNRIGQINSFFDTYGNLYDENTVKAMRSDLSNIDSSLTEWLDEASAEDYLEKIKTPPTVSTSTVATAIKDKESEKARAERGGRDTTQITAELNAMYDNGGAYGQAAKRRNEYNANKSALASAKAELASIINVSPSVNTKAWETSATFEVDPVAQKRIAELNKEIESLETKISDYEKAYLASDDAWLEAFGLGEDLSAYENVTYGKNEDPIAYIAKTTVEPFEASSFNNALSADERIVYNYLLKNKGVKAAQKWLSSGAVRDTINQRIGQAEGAFINERFNSNLPKTALASAYGISGGIGNYANGLIAPVAATINPKALSTPASIYANQEASKDLGFFGKALSDVSVSIGNMAPSIVLGAVNPVLGQASFGVSAAGNSYNEARKEGKTVEQAALYGIVSGASEVFLQSILGGIPGISGASNKLVNAAKNLKTPALRALAVYGIDIAGEAAEEYLQDILEPMFRNAIFHEDNEVKIFTGEAAYSAMLGALTSAILNIPTLSTKSTKQLGAAMIDGGWYDTLLDNALKLDKDSNAFDLANKLKNGELTASEENVGELLRAYKTDDGDLSFLEEKGTIEEMPNSVVTESVDNLKAETNPSELKGEALVLNLLADGEVSNSKAKKILEDTEALKVIGADVEGLDTISKKRAVIKEAMQNYIAQNAEKIASNAQRETTAQTATNTATEAQGKDADTFQYKHIVEKQKLGTRLLSELEGRTSKAGEKLADKLTAMATSITGDEDANRAVYKLFANPRYAAAASIENGADFLEIIRNFKTDAGKNFARQQMSGFINDAATAATMTELLRKDVNVTLENAAGMKPSEGKSAPKGYYDETDHRVAIADNLLTYETLVGTIAHEGFHANGAIDRELVNNFAKTLEGLWGKDEKGNSVWEATVKRKKDSIEAYTGKPTTTLKAEEEVCAEALTNLFNTQKAWDVMGEMFGKIEGSDRLLNRIKNSLDRFFANFKKRFKGEMPAGKLTTFRENIEHLIKETKGVKKETKKEAKKKEKAAKTEAKLEAELEAELAEENELAEDAEVDEEVDEEADEVVDLVSDYADKTKGRMFSSSDTDVILPTAEDDAKYLDAVNRGDMETAKRMVYEAADKAMPNSKIRAKDGSLIPVYHGTKEMFYEFDTTKKGGLNGTAEGFGIYLSDDTEVTEAYGDRQIKMYANITKPASSEKKTISTSTLVKLIKDTCEKQAQQMVDDGEYDSVKDALMDTWVSNYVYTYELGMERSYRETANTIMRLNGSDMDVIQEVMSGMAIRDYSKAMDFYRNSLTPITGFDGIVTQWENSSTGKKSNIYLAFDSSQLKSADPVTYDDNGNIIPLSERFNPENNDIRYSSADTDVLLPDTDITRPDIDSPSMRRDLTTLESAKDTNGGRLYNYKAMEADEEEYRKMLKKHGGLADNEIEELFNTVDAVVDRIKETIESDAELARAIDFGWERDIDDRAYSPLKQNSDKLYKVSLDFSTMCRKRILQQITQSQIQEAMDKTLDAKESIAVRQALAKLIDMGFQIEVACKLCYVESARLKSPAQIKKFLENKEQVLIEFLGGKSAKVAVKEAEAAIREKLGVGNTPLKQLDHDTAEKIREVKRKTKAEYQPSAEESKYLETIRTLTRKDFTTPEGLENLAKNHYEIFNAYTSYVRNATKSKAVENDTWFRAGDTAAVGDKLIANMNTENGLRSQSWSDFQVIHLLDYIAATIELSTRGAKEQVYTKVPDFVKLMHGTNAMINLSLIPAKEYNGKLEYDKVEGMAFDIAMKLREKYPDVAGTICIGIANEQIQKLLASEDIDYVIPYHSSALNKHLRKAMDIPTWEDYQSYQGEKALSEENAKENAMAMGVELDKEKWHKAPSFSEWFDLKTAKEIAKSAKHGKYGVMTGAYMAMQNAADNYKRLCAERGLLPKFSYGKADFSNEENYWKLLIDRKMVNQETGEIIEQKPLTPKFNLDEITEIMDDAIAQYPTVSKHQDAATEVVTKLFVNGKVRGDMSAEEIYSAVEKAVLEETDNTTVYNILESAKDLDDGRMFSAEETDVELPTIEERKLERERIKREGKKAGKSTAEINQELYEYDKAQNDLAATAFGTIEPGEKRAREFNAPKQTTKSDKVSLTARTVGEAGVTPEIALPRLESMIANGTFSYEPLKNKDLVAKAKAKIGTTQNSFDNALHAWMGNEKLISAEEIATGWLLYDKAIELGRVDTALDIATVISQDARRAGQAVQANRILKSLTPEGQLYVAQRTAERLTDKLKAEGKTPRVRYTEEDAAVVETARKFGKRRAEDAIAREARKLSRSKEDNVPVEDWAKEIGNDVAEAISKRMEPLKKDLLVSRAVASDLLKFAENYALPKKQGPSRTAAERIADFFANRAQYIEAWNQARDVLREKYKDSPEKLDLLEAFLNGTVDYNGEGSDIIMMRAVAEAALNNDVKIQDLMRRAELGDIKGVIDDIYNRLQETVTAEGSDAQLVRDAVQRWVTEKYVQAHPLTQRQIDAVIRKKMVKLGKSVDYIVRSDRKNKGELLQQITAMLVEAFGVSPEAASIAAIKIKERYDGILEKAATSAFERATKERKPAQKKTLDELFMNYANMGAFTSDYDKALTEKLFKRDGIVVDKKLAEDLLNAETEEGRKAALEAIYRDIGSQLPSTFADRERAWRYLAMLGNFRTHGRNISGNAIFGGVIRTKDLIATAIEAGAEKRFGIERTKAVLNPKKDKALLEAARGDAAVIHDMLVYGEKYNDQATNDAIESGRVIFKNKALETLRKKNTEWLEKEDAFFLNRHYAHALAQYCKANGITAKDIQNGNVPDAAREYAIKEAKKATFRDDNDFSKKVSQMRFKGDGVGSKVGNFFVEGILPFRKTPANILVRGVEYSPIGLVKGTYHLFGKVRKGEMSAAEAIDEIASGLTGTGLLLFGYILTALGFIRATGDEEDREMEELMGHQSYALEIGNRSYTLDWLAPAALPFFVGAEIAELKKLEGDVKMADIADAFKHVMEPMLELSCLQSLNDALDGVSYSDNKLSAFLVNAATSRLAQYVPTLLGQLERTTESARMSTYTDKDSFIDSDTQYLLGKISAKTPIVDYQQIPYIDAWGRVEDSGNIFSRAAENLIHPFYSSKIEESAMEMELQRLNDSTGEKSVYPKRADKTITVAKEVDGKRVSEDYNLSAEEYVQYAKAKGKTAYDAITAFMGGDVYKMLDDTERVEAIEDIYSYADEYARTVITDHELEGWKKEAADAQRKGMSFDTFFNAYVSQISVKADKDFLGNAISGTAAEKRKEIIDSITTDEKEREMLYGYLDVGVTAQNNGIISDIMDAAINKDTTAYDTAVQAYLDNNKGADKSDVHKAVSKYQEELQMKFAKLSYDDPAEYERQIAKYRNGKDRVIASKFTERAMATARTKWLNEYTDELARKLAKYSADTENEESAEKVELIYAEAAKYGIKERELKKRADKLK
jgi:hypothetical protein